jgi:hypothetical protein
MGTPTYSNEIKKATVSLGIERLLLAPEGTAYTPARIDISSPPSGFIDVGAVVDDSVSVSITRDIKKLLTGIPKGPKRQWVVEIGAEVTGRFITNDNAVLEYILGNVYKYNEFKTTVPASLTTIDSVTDRDVLTLAASPGVGWFVGDFVATSTTTTGLATTANMARISSISGLNIYFSDYTFNNTPAASDYAAVVKLTRMPFGTSQLKKFVLIGVADLVDGYQIQHYMPEVSPTGDWSEMIQPEPSEMDFTFSAYTTTTSYYTGADEQIPGERFWFPPVTS